VDAAAPELDEEEHIEAAQRRTASGPPRLRARAAAPVAATSWTGGDAADASALAPGARAHPPMLSPPAAKGSNYERFGRGQAASRLRSPPRSGNRARVKQKREALPLAGAHRTPILEPLTCIGLRPVEPSATL
jgi:hypothetical protein